MEIRRGRPADLPEIKKCLIDSWVTHAQHEPDFLDEERMRSSDIETYYHKCFGSENCFILIAEDDNKMRGFARVDIQQIQDFFKHTKVLFVDDIYVPQEYRGQHIASLLLKEIEKIARELDIKWIKARIYTWNLAAQRLFESSQFHPLYAEWFKALE